MNNYILNYNPLGNFPSEGQLLGLVRINRHVIQYYQPFFGTYLLKSNDEAYTLNESFKHIFENTPYMLTLFSSGLTSGSLPQDAWNWINHGILPKSLSPAPPPPTTGVGSAVTRGLLSGFRESVMPPPPPKR